MLTGQKTNKHVYIFLLKEPVGIYLCLDLEL